jgi:hypothetical protein
MRRLPVDDFEQKATRFEYGPRERPKDYGFASSEAKWQKTVRMTLTPDYLRLKLCDSENSKFVLLSDKLNVPIFINLGSDTHRPTNQDALSPGEKSLSSR